MQLALDRRQRDVDDRHIQHDHELSEGDDEEGEVEVPRHRPGRVRDFLIHLVFLPMCAVDFVRRRAQTQVFVDADEPELQELVAREGHPGGCVADHFGLDHPVAAA